MIITNIVMISPASVNADTQSTYYVSPSGSDSNPGTFDQPFLTIQKARDAVSTINSDMTGDINVYLRGGEYNLDNTIAFTSADSGTNGYNVKYEAYTGETPVITGGVKIAGSSFTNQGNGVYRAAFNSVSDFRQMYVNGVRATRACSSATYTATDYHYDSDNNIDGYIVDDSVIGYYENPDNVELVWSTYWRCHRLPVSSIVSAETGKKAIIMKQPYLNWSMTLDFPDGRPNYNNSFYIENALELLDQPGEWYFDKVRHYIYYMPGSGVDMSTAVVEIPDVENLITIEGSSLTNQVHNITIQGLTFEDTTWMRPSTEGASTLQASFMISGPYQAAYSDDGILPPAAIQIDHAKNIYIADNILRKLGAAAVKMENDVQDSQVTGNNISDVSADGVIIDTWKHNYIDPSLGEGLCTNILVRNNTISEIAREYWDSPAITVYYGKLIDIQHNDISNIPYTGISMGWNGWGGRETDSFSLGQNRISWNRISDFLEKGYDGGAIYSLNTQPGTVWEGNYIKNMNHPFGALYPDEGSGYITLKNNVVENVGIYYWLHVWASTINHLTVDNNYTTTSNQDVNGSKCTVTNTHVVTDGNWPTEALNIISNSGVTTTAYVPLTPATVPAGNLAYMKNCYAYYLDGTTAAMHAGSDAYRAVDGYYDTYSQATDQYVWKEVVDLGSPWNINNVVVKFPYTPVCLETLYATSYCIKVSTDGTNYSEVATITDCAGGTSSTAFAAVTARYVMIEAVNPDGEGQTGGQMAISELEIYSSESTPTPVPTTPITFTPPALSNLKLWLDAGVGVTKDGNRYVSAWCDQSGSGNNAVQAVQENKPRFAENVINGYPVVRFDGTKDFVEASGVSGSMSNFTIIYVIKPGVLTSNQVIAADGGWGQFEMHSADATGGAYAGTDLATRMTPTNTGTGIFTVNAVQMLEFTFGDGTGKLYKNGVLEASQAMTTPGNWAGFKLGENSISTINGDIAEVFVYNSVLSDSDRQTIESYLNGKYNIFIPPALSNLKLWLDAGTGVIKDGNNYVSIWYDQSGSGNNAAQSIQDKEPLWVSNTLYGKPVIRFDGTNDFITASGASGAMNNFTIIYVIKPSVLSLNQVIAADGGWGQFEMHSADSNGGVYAGIDVATRLTPTDTGSGIYEVNKAETLEFTLEGGTGKLYKNGILKASKTMTATSNWTGFRLGEDSTSTIYGDIAEVFVYNSVLSDNDRQVIENYLNNKYGIL